jgi:transmembrane sensor
MASSDSLRVEEAAAAWLARRDRDEWTAADQAEFTQWLHASTAHRVAYLRLKSAWEQAHRLRAIGAGAMPGVVPPAGEWRRSPFFERQAATTTSDPATANIDNALDGARPGTRSKASAVDPLGAPTHQSRFAPRRRGLHWTRSASRALAASVLFAIAVGSGWYFWPQPSVYRTDVGGLQSVPLSDGSQVTLNTASEIRVAVTDTERRVTLARGEAFFEVAKDAKRPFVVSVANKRVIAVGTKFSVRREADNVRVVVTEGRVRVERIGGQQGPAEQLSAGTVARAGDAGTLVQEKPLAEAEEYLSWRTGFLVFRDSTLGEAVAEFNRYNTHQIVVEDPAVAAIHVGGSFRSNNVDAFIRLIEQGLPVRAERSDDRIVLKAT